MPKLNAEANVMNGTGSTSSNATKGSVDVHRGGKAVYILEVCILIVVWQTRINSRISFAKLSLTPY